MAIKKICLDLDGVIVDFHTPAITLQGMDPVSVLLQWPRGEYELGKVLNVDINEFWRNVDSAGVHFWANLKKYSWSDRLIETVFKSGLNSTILTTPSRSPFSSHGKVHWIQGEFGETFRKYILCANCKSFCADSETLLIDDSDHNCEKFVDAGGHAVLWPQPWNKSNQTVDEAINEIERLISAQ